MCLKCNKATSSMRLDPGAKNSVNFQLYANDKYMEYFVSQMLKIQTFQNTVNHSLIDHLKKKVLKYQDAYTALNRQYAKTKDDFAAAKSDIAMWQKEKKRLTDENRSLRETVHNLQKDVTTLKNKLTGERHSAGASARSRPVESASNRYDHYAQRTGPQSANSLIPERLTLAQLDRNPTPVNGPPLVPPFPNKHNVQNGTPLTINQLKIGGLMSNESFGKSSKTFRFDHM